MKLAVKVEDSKSSIRFSHEKGHGGSALGKDIEGFSGFEGSENSGKPGFDILISKSPTLNLISRLTEGFCGFGGSENSGKPGFERLIVKSPTLKLISKLTEGFGGLGSPISGNPGFDRLGKLQLILNSFSFGSWRARLHRARLLLLLPLRLLLGVLVLRPLLLRAHRERFLIRSQDR